MTRRPAPEPFVTSSWSQSSPPQVAGDVEAEHHAALHVLGDIVLGDMAMGHPHAGASGVALALREAGLVTAASIVIGVLAGLVVFIAFASYQLRQFRRVRAAVAPAL